MASSGKDIGREELRRAATRFAVPFRTEQPGRRSTVVQSPEEAASPVPVGGGRAPVVTSAGPRGAATSPRAAASGTDDAPDDAPARAKGKRRSRTIPMRQLTRDEILQSAELSDLVAYERPSTRQDCVSAPRPCPFVSCRHHLYLEVNDRTGSIKLNFPDIELAEMRETCALDIADRGGATLEEIGDILNLTRERIRQLEARGLERLREAGFGQLFAGFFADRHEPE